MNNLKIDKISPSSLDLFEKSPKLWYYRNWLGLQLPQPQRHFEFGHAIHSAIDNVYEQYDKKTGWEFSEKKKVIDIFRKNWKRSAITNLDAETENDKKVMYAKMLDDGIKMLNAFWNDKEKLLLDGVKPNEFEKSIRLTPNGWPICLSGRLDGRNRKEMIICEFKTSGQKYDESETRRSLQTLSYVMLEYIETQKICDVHYIILLKNRVKDRIQHLHFNYDKSDIDEYQERVKNIFKLIENRDFNEIGKVRFLVDDVKRIEEKLSIT